MNLLARLSEAPAATVVARRSYRLAAVALDCPLLVMPLSGSKHVSHADTLFECEPGHFLMVHQSIRADVENRPATTAPYRAVCITFPWRLVAIARQLLTPSPPRRPGIISTDALDGIVPALLEWADTDAADTATLDYRRIGLLIALHAAGHSGFLAADKHGWADRIHTMVTADPARDWSSAHLETAFHVSGATLRRRLAREHTTLRNTIRDARLHAALVMIQSQHRPLRSIAAAVGYRSVASFRRQFLERFGIEPGRVAGDI